MKRNEIQKMFFEEGEEQEIDQLRYPFILDREESGEAPYPFLMSDVEHDPSSLQRDFLTHKSLNLQETKDAFT